MNRLSLRLRLLLVWAMFIALALLVAGLGLRLLFERSILRRTQIELEADLRQLRRGMEKSANGELRIVRAPTDPQFDIGFGGRYWQVEEDAAVIARSRSLQATVLNLPTDLRFDTQNGTASITGPEGQRLFAVIRAHVVPGEGGSPDRALRITTAVDSSEIEDDTRKFTSDLIKGLAGLASVLLLGAWAHVTVGLAPLKLLSAKVAEVRSGSARRLDGAFPEEVMPLVTETNALLDAQAEALGLARARAGDLAHGLKTPLAIIGANGRTLRRRGEMDIADELDRQIETMRRHVDRELARARARGVAQLGHAQVDAVPLLDEIVRAVDRIPREAPIEWRLDFPEVLSLPADTDDINNIAGNLIENASKWTHGIIAVGARQIANGVEITVDDNGPGIPEEFEQEVLKRGVRADESVAGTGLGLAIVSDLVALYDGKITLSKSSLGGLKAAVFIPRA